MGEKSFKYQYYFQSTFSSIVMCYQWSYVYQYVQQINTGTLFQTQKPQEVYMFYNKRS